jgi:heptosyltransferase-2
LNNILIIQTAFLGDVVLATPLIEELRQQYPEANIDFLLRRGNQSLLQDHPQLRELMIWDKKNGKYREMMRLVRKIRKNKYDLVVNAQRFAASGFITAFSGAKSKVGFKKNPLSFLFSKSVPHELGKKGEKNATHEVRRNLSLIGAGGKDDATKPKLYPSDADFARIMPLTSEPFITLSPASVWFTKQFPSEKWVSLADQLAQYRIFILGSPDDAELGELIRGYSIHPDISVLASKLSLLQSAALMSKATMNYVNDSAPMHLASAMNAPTTAIYCSTIPEFGFGPLSDQSSVVQSKESLECRPCGLHGKKECPLGHFNCAMSITNNDLLEPLQS